MLHYNPEIDVNSVESLGSRKGFVPFVSFPFLPRKSYRLVVMNFLTEEYVTRIAVVRCKRRYFII